MNKRITAIVLAAGQGKRMNSSVAKQFLILKGKPILYYSLKAFEESEVDNIILVTGKEQVSYCRDEIVNYYNFQKVTDVIEGGAERYDSVYEALKKAETSNIVLIHDGARPFISRELIERVIMEVEEYGACLVGTPVKETIKVIDSEGYIASTPKRSSLWAAQTPQAFEYTAIKRAYDLFYGVKDRDSLDITDDAMVYEAFYKGKVKMLYGDYNNLKITTPEDLMLAEKLLE